MIKSHFTFMAGLSFLYSFFNLYTTGGGQGVPTVEEAMMDIESCMAVLEYLTRKSSSVRGIDSPSTIENPCRVVFLAVLDLMIDSSLLPTLSRRGVTSLPSPDPKDLTACSSVRKRADADL